MSARIIPFPRHAPFEVVLRREGQAWLVVCRDHGWLHSDRRSAMRDAREIAHGFGVPFNLETTT